MIWKMSPLVIAEILWVFVNTLSADGKYRMFVNTLREFASRNSNVII